MGNIENGEIEISLWELLYDDVATRLDPAHCPDHAIEQPQSGGKQAQYQSRPYGNRATIKQEPGNTTAGNAKAPETEDPDIGRDFSVVQPTQYRCGDGLNTIGDLENSRDYHHWHGKGHDLVKPHIIRCNEKFDP